VLFRSRKPRELEEIVQLTKVNESNARRWLLKLESQGVVTKTRKRMGIGRPKNIYYLSQRLQLSASNNGAEQQ
jgi:predicted ArsR family transcriptional regulator